MNPRQHGSSVYLQTNDGTWERNAGVPHRLCCPYFEYTNNTIQMPLQSAPSSEIPRIGVSSPCEIFSVQNEAMRAYRNVSRDLVVEAAAIADNEPAPCH